jgi:hypothetical protein
LRRYRKPDPDKQKMAPASDRGEARMKKRGHGWYRPDSESQ